MHRCTYAVAFLHRTANYVGGVGNVIALAITVPPLPAAAVVFFDDRAEAYWRQLKLTLVICNWLLSLSSLTKPKSCQEAGQNCPLSSTSGRQVFFMLGK